MADDPFGDLMRRRGVNPAPASTRPQSRETKDAGEASEAAAKGRHAERKVTSDIQHTESETANTEARTGLAGEQTRLTGARADAQERTNVMNTGPGAQRAALATRMQDIELTRGLLGNIQTARNLLGKTATGPAGQLTQGIWGTSSANLREALKAVASREVIDTIMRMKAASATGATGFGQLSNQEGDYLKSQLGSLSQSQSPEQLMRTLNNIELSYRKFMAYTSGIDPTSPEGAYWAGLAKPSEGNGRIDVPVSANGQFKWEPDPNLRGLNNTVVDMIKAGRSESQIKDWLSEINPDFARTTDIQTNIDLWKAGGEPRANIEGRWTPKSAAADLIGKVTDSPVGAFGMGAADVLTMGGLDEMTNDPNLARSGMERAREEHPNATAAGNFTGGALSALLAEAAAAKAGIQMSPWVLDALQSGAYGYGSGDSDNRVSSALASAALGALGGAALRGTAKGVGAVARGTTNKASQLLAKYNIPMTVGQITQRGARGFEEKAMSWPGIGSMIRTRRGESLTGFNRAAFDEALAPIGASTNGQIGQQGMAVAEDAVSQAYRDALDGTQIVFDKGFADDLAKATGRNVHQVPTIGPEVDGELARIISQYVGDGTQPLSGELFQAARQELRALRSGYAGKPNYRGVRGAIDDTEDALTNAFERQNPGQLDKYLAADTAYKHVSILGDAVSAAPATENGVFSPATLGQQVRTNTRKFSGRMANATGRRPFNDLVVNGGAILPSKTPDSGTAGRILLPLAIAGLTGGGKYLSSGDVQTDRQGNQTTVDRDLSGSTLFGGLAGLAAALPYSRSGQRMAQWALTGPRSQGAVTIGDLLTKYASAAGRGGAAVAASEAVDRVPNPTVPDDILVNTDIIERAIRQQRKLLEREGPQAIGAGLGFPQLNQNGAPAEEEPQ